MATETAKNSKQLPAPKADTPKQLTLVEQVEQELQSLTSANFYEVPGRGGGKRMEPDSRALQHYANKSGGIATKVLESGMDMEKAWAHVQAWPKRDPTMVMEDKVTIVYELEFQSYVWDYIGRGCQRHKGGCPVVKGANGKALIVDGMPQLEDGTDVLELRRLLNRKMRFAEREAITKAKSRLYKLIMNMEWRDVEEIENETQDVRTINDNSPLPALNAPQAATAAPAAKTAKTEAPQAATAPAAPAAKPAAKAKEEPKKAPAGAATPATASEKKEAVQGPPKAAIPPDPSTKPAEAAPATSGEPTAPKKRSERISDLTVVLQTSAGNILAFAAERLSCAPAALGEKKEDLDCIIYALENSAKKYPPTTVGIYVKGEGMSEEFKKKIADDFLIFFATEKNRLAERS